MSRPLYLTISVGPSITIQYKVSAPPPIYNLRLRRAIWFVLRTMPSVVSVAYRYSDTAVIKEPLGVVLVLHFPPLKDDRFEYLLLPTQFYANDAPMHSVSQIFGLAWFRKLISRIPTVSSSPRLPCMGSFSTSPLGLMDLCNMNQVPDRFYLYAWFYIG
jgi:hypothetical protein